MAKSLSALVILRKTAARADLRFSRVTGALEMLSGGGAPLSEAAPGVAGGELVKRFLTRNEALYGLSASDVDSLNVIGESNSPSGLRMVRVEQRIAGMRVFLSESRFLLDRQGRMQRSLGALVPNVLESAGAAPTVTAEEAVSKLLNSVSIGIAVGDLQRKTTDIHSGESGKIMLTSSDARVAGEVTTELGYFPLRSGVVVPAWQVVAFTSTDADWYGYVEAESGVVLWRKNIRDNISAHDARFRVYVQADGITPADSPAPASPSAAVPGAGTQFPGIAPSIVRMQTAQVPTASPNGWIDDCPGGVCSANQTQTLGNNTLTCMDRTVGTGGGGVATNVCDTDADSLLDGNGRPTGNPDTAGRNRDFLGTSPRDFQTGFLPPPQGGNPEAGQTSTGTGAALDSFRRGTATSLFYIANWYHDQVFGLGFDEAAGNFQQTNFSASGQGGDRVLGDVQDGSGTDNANFSTPPDGTSGRMQMFRFTGPDVDRDSSLDAEIVIHELTHGLSNRLVGNGHGLNWAPARGMGEGWSDFYALSLLNNTNADNPDARYAAAAYATYKAFGVTGYTDNYVYGIRRFPYSTDITVNPLTWADVDDVANDLSGGIAPDPLGINSYGAMEVHNIGEIWANTLWEVRSRVIADPTGANGSVPTGNHTTLQLVTDGLKMTPNDPSFTDARDAILDADCITNACANETSIWAGFADRGLGYGALTPYTIVGAQFTGHMGITESFSSPFLNAEDLNTDIAIDDSVGGNNNGAVDPGETVRITIALTNPWRGAGKTATGGTAGLTTSTTGVTILDGNASYPTIVPQGIATGDSFQLRFDPGLTCASAIDLVLSTSSSVGSGTRNLKLRVGTRNGTDAPATYTKSGALDIPDRSRRGVVSTLSVTDDLEIADLNYRLDSVTHTGVFDITAMLRSPGGTGIDLVTGIGALSTGFSADDIVNMVIDDDLPNASASDMTQAPLASAPFTRSWHPVFNSPGSQSYNFGYPIDPVGNLSRFDGQSTRGLWSTLVSDQATQGVGTLNAWSMIVTPVHFDCTPFTATSPTVQSIARINPSPTNLGSVSFTVTFSQAVTGVDAADFALTKTGIAGASVTGVSGSGTTRTVAVKTGTGNGSLRLDVVDNDSIRSTSTSTPLGGTGPGNGNFNTGQVYTLDKLGPKVTTVVAAGQANPTTASPILFTVQFDESTVQLSSTDIALSGTAGATAAVIAGSGSTYTVSVSGMTVAGTVIASVKAAAIQDAVGNNSTASGTATVTFQMASSAPTVTIAANPTTITLGASSTLTWSSTKATSCTASGSWKGTRATSGSANVKPTKTGSASYKLTCTGSGGNKANATAKVTVRPR